jgi:hypothetical protein
MNNAIKLELANLKIKVTNMEKQLIELDNLLKSHQH